jgi:hypothetical protein
VAEDLNADVRPSSLVESTAVAESGSLVAPPRRVDEPRVFRARFAVAYVLLAVLAGIGLGAAYLLVERPEAAPGAKWSSWKPTGRESSYPSQIASFVMDRYERHPGNPRVLILADVPQVQGIPLRTVAFGNDRGDPNDISIVRIDSDKSTMYDLCGGGAQCSFADGQSSPERDQVLQREALELALYTFKYADIDSVIATLPPDAPDASGQRSAGRALFFQRGDLEDALDRPIARTLIATDRPSAEVTALETRTLGRLAGAHLYSYVFTQAQEGSALMVLTPTQ